MLSTGETLSHIMMALSGIALIVGADLLIFEIIQNNPPTELTRNLIQGFRNNPRIRKVFSF